MQSGKQPMPLDFDIENTVFTKQIYNAGKQFACEQFMHSLGVIMGKKRIHLDERRQGILFHLSPRELSDFNVVISLDGQKEVYAFLDGERDASPRGRIG